MCLSDHVWQRSLKSAVLRELTFGVLRRTLQSLDKRPDRQQRCGRHTVPGYVSLASATLW